MFHMSCVASGPQSTDPTPYTAHHRRSRRNKAIALAIAGSMLGSWCTPRTARADTPLVVPILLGIGTGVAANYLYDYLKSKPADPPPKQRMTKTTTIKKPDGTFIQQTITVDPELDSTDPTSNISLPGAWSSPPLAGDTSSGTLGAFLPTDNGIPDNGAYLAAGGQIGGNVEAVPGAYGNETGTYTRTAVTDDIIQGYADRNTSGPVPLTLNIGGPLNISTTNLSDTTATVSYMVTLSSVDLGGTLFQAGVSISQNASSYTLIDGGIPGASYDVTSPGVLQVTFNESSIPIETLDDTVDHFDYTLDTTYTDTETITVVPEPASISLTAVAAVGLLARGRRHAAVV